MNDCDYCPVEKECHYPYKPCDCVHQRKFQSKERREEHYKVIRDVSKSVCSCSKGKGIDHDEEGNAYCVDCGKYLGQIVR